MSSMEKMRPVRVWEPRIRVEERADGSSLIWQEDPLGDYPDRLSDRIHHWAATAPTRVWMAERGPGGHWIKVTYADLLDQMRRVGSFLLQQGLSLERPLLILSENSLDHAVAALAAQYVGVPSAAVAPAYSLIGAGHGKLRDIAEQVTPGAVFAKHADRFAPAIRDVFAPEVPLILSGGAVAGREAHRWEDVLATPVDAAADAANRATGPETVAKFLFTSGTTGSPKAVILTQRMLCANMVQVLDCYRFLEDEPPVLVDWAPWNHVAAGNKVFNLTLWNGGTYYIDAGKPTPEGMQETIRNLREVSPTWYFNVPVGYEMLCEAMEQDAELRDSFYRDLRMIVYAGAGMASHTWHHLLELSERSTGARTLMGSGLGSTETAPFAMFCTEPQEEPGNCGVPVRGMTMKLVPTGGKLEVRFKGPNITPGYWRRPDLTAKAFDEEGFYNMGDAMRPAVPGDPARGFVFDGRTAENFKLQTGTWVAVGAMRAQLVDAMEGLIRDAVITGENQMEMGALMLPVRPRIERLVEGGAALSDAELYARPEVEARLAALLSQLAEGATGSSNRIARALLLVAPLDLAKGEVTDKGSVNQRAVLAHRGDLVARLYEGGPGVILARKAETQRAG
ncbi:feruloyl-CoA synthase [Maritimibacter alkaliphilus]|uniref:feruloyl-CoA synthase n=1 Tax=Maritimibacter alkaliphilus TaxID=404236 RepID=UPI001C9853FF|nr:feruloyl-CoA synthase [Maritimibacter alkaliphilus]MBY6089628.1 feruloyl-CoA synthase [Maritimibacter alkaliphilus]